MSFEELINSGIFVSILTVLATCATCVISESYGYRKLKTEKFSDIYDCLNQFIEERARIVGMCNQMSHELAAIIPEKPDNKTEKKYREMYDKIYNGMNEMIAEYSKFLDLFMSFSFYMFKNKAIRPVIKAECWSFLNLYEQVIEIQGDISEPYGIEYAQIASLAQMIRLSGKWKDRRMLNKYLKRYHVTEI